MIMPPLPEPAHEQVEDYSGIAVNKTVVTPLFTSDQMRAYAEQAVAAERAEIERLRTVLQRIAEFPRQRNGELSIEGARALARAALKETT